MDITTLFRFIESTMEPEQAEKFRTNFFRQHQEQPVETRPGESWLNLPKAKCRRAKEGKILKGEIKCSR